LEKFRGDRPVRWRNITAISLLSEHNSELQDFFCEQLTFDSFIFIFKKPFLGRLIVGVRDNKFIVGCGVKNARAGAWDSMILTCGLLGVLGKWRSMRLGRGSGMMFRSIPLMGWAKRKRDDS
jgi:hypothetical protein